MPYEPLHHKYRPQTFAQLVGQEAIAATLSNAMIEDRIAPAYLFTGPRGTGKTSSARILAKSLNCLRDKRPTPTPCGECETCREITRGSAMDIVEIDAASNTGVDNIREIIERAQFAPVRCRYKVYVIDECLTGDTQILTRQGSMRLDDNELEGKEVLSYNETRHCWEFKRVRRWLDRGEREIFSLKTRTSELQCTGNHLIRTAAGWQEARSLQPGTEILSPAPTLARSDFRQPSSELAGMTRARSQHLPTDRILRDRVTTDTSYTPHWQTTLEPLEEISPAGIARVYDLEVEDNHNFVANGLLVHNCHMLSTAAFNALLKTLEEPPPRVIFVLATTDPQRVLNTIISRCQRFDFRRIPLKEMVAHLTTIAQKENIEIEAEALTMVAQLAEGGLRDAESNLDRLSLLAGTVTVERIWDLVGAVPERDLLELLRAIATDEAETVISRCRHLMDRGREPLAVLQSLAGFYLNLLIAKTSPQRGDLVSVTSATWEQLRQEAQRWETAAILHGQQHLKDSEPQIKNTVQPRLWLEVTLLGLLPSARTLPAAQPAVAAAPNSRTNGTAQNVSTSPPAPVFEKRQEKTIAAESAKPSTPPQPIPEAPAQPPREPVVAQSPAVTPPSQSSTPPSAADLHKERVQKIWQRVLEAIVPPASQAFLRQKCQLLDFDLDDCIAYVGVASPNTLGMAENKRGNIEAAFERVWQQKVKVHLQIATSAPASGSVQPPPSQAPAPERRESSPPPTVVAPAPPQSDIQTVLASPPIAKTITEQPATPIKAPPQESVETNRSSISSPAPATEEEVLDTEESNASKDEVVQAALELAKLFDGEILNDNFLGNSVMASAAIAPLTDESELESLPLAEEEKEEEDEDIPF